MSTPAPHYIKTYAHLFSSVVIWAIKSFFVQIFLGPYLHYRMQLASYAETWKMHLTRMLQFTEQLVVVFQILKWVGVAKNEHHHQSTGSLLAHKLARWPVPHSWILFQPPEALRCIFFKYIEMCRHKKVARWSSIHFSEGFGFTHSAAMPTAFESSGTGLNFTIFKYQFR